MTTQQIIAEKYVFGSLTARETALLLPGLGTNDVYRIARQVADPQSRASKHIGASRPAAVFDAELAMELIDNGATATEVARHFTTTESAVLKAVRAFRRSG